MSQNNIKQLLVDNFGEEHIWQSVALNTISRDLISKLASRSGHSLPVIPQKAIEAMGHKISQMSVVDGDGTTGGEYLAFVETLRQEIESSDTESTTELSTLGSVLALSDGANLNASCVKVKEIYTDFMGKSSVYADAQYEGRALAEFLQIHLIVQSYSVDGAAYPSQHFGPDVSDIVPTIELHHFPGNRGAHFVLHKVGTVEIPHSIYGGGNCLFEAFAQAVLELYIQGSGLETNVTLTNRRYEQIQRGKELDLISDIEEKNMLETLYTGYHGSITPSTVFEAQGNPLDYNILFQKLKTYQQELKIAPNMEKNIQKMQEIALLKKTIPMNEGYLKSLEILEKSKFKNESKQSKSQTTGIDRFKEKLKASIKTAKDDIEKSNDKLKQIVKEEEKCKSYQPPKDLDNVLGTNFCFLKIYQDQIQKSAITHTKPYVRHYGINPEHTKGLVDCMIEKDELHPIELQLFEKSVAVFDVCCDSTTFITIRSTKYPNNVILVDIFSRNPDNVGCVYVEKRRDGKVEGSEAHTIVLWKTSDNELTLIDPIYEPYSKFLVGKNIGKYHIVSGMKEKQQLYSSKKAGYCDYKEHPMKHRDCTDIAAKIAFELNEKQLLVTTTSTQEVLELTTSLISDNDIRKALQELNTRALQSSDSTTRKNAQDIVNKFIKYSDEKGFNEIVDYKKVCTIEDAQEVNGILGELESWFLVA